MTVQGDRKKAIFLAIERARPGDVILICGKGHETDQIVADKKGVLIKHHFDDCEVAREALAERPVAKPKGAAAKKAAPKKAVAKKKVAMKKASKKKPQLVGSGRGSGGGRGGRRKA